MTTSYVGAMYVQLQAQAVRDMVIADLKALGDPAMVIPDDVSAISRGTQLVYIGGKFMVVLPVDQVIHPAAVLQAEGEERGRFFDRDLART